MSDEERRDSLADQAAAWVPPWERPAPPTPVAEPQAVAPLIADDAQAAEPTDTVPQASDEQLATQAEEKPTPPIAAEATMHEAPIASVPGVDEQFALAPVAAEATMHEAPVTSEPAVDEQPAAAVPVKPPTQRGRRTAPAAEPVAPMPDTELRGALEAILLVVDEPVSELVLAQVVDEPAERVGRMLDDIAAGYTEAGHGFELRRAAGGWRLYTRPEYASHVERFILDGQSVRLTQAALETLAVIAYRQPVTRSRVSAVRGVNCDGVIRTLVTRGLIEECGTEPDSGAFLYRTTTLFLEKLGLNSVDELPPLAPFLPTDVEELADVTP